MRDDKKKPTQAPNPSDMPKPSDYWKVVHQDNGPNSGGVNYPYATPNNPTNTDPLAYNEELAQAMHKFADDRRAWEIAHGML